MSDVELVVIGTYLSRIEAELAQGALEAAEIESMVEADDAGGLYSGLGMSGVRLLVRADDAGQAAEILSGSDRS